jgi:hypothetical protein
MVGTRKMVGHNSRAGIPNVLVCDGGVRGFGHYFARPGGGCVLKGTVWTPVGCVGGQGTVQDNSWCVLIISGLGEAVHVCQVHFLDKLQSIIPLKFS